ncbi:MAG: O-antigen ligase family protein [Planctomycetaceae bacterium]|nr:O-antigen ligase family protein [Planctomycetaceae bacterium]
MAKRKPKQVLQPEAPEVQVPDSAQVPQAAPLPSRKSRIDLAFWTAGNIIVFSQLFVPPEGLGMGNLVLIQTAWFALLALWAAFRLKFGNENERIAFDEIDLLLVLLSGLPLLGWTGRFLSGGDLQTGVYHVLGWLMTGSVILLFRRWLPRFGWGLPLALLIAGGLTAGGMGVWQNRVFYPQTSAEISPLVEQYESLIQIGNGTAESGLSETQLRQKSELERRLTELGVPLDTRSLRMFLQRLRDSREPFGFFALANTLGGYLSCITLLLIGIIVFRWQAVQTKAFWKTILLVGMAVLIFYCLLLTKSRTALLALIAGVLLFFSLQWASSHARGRDVLLGGAGLAGGAGLLLLLACLTGGIDVEVFSESNLSVRYRLEYWQATWAMLQDHFWLGTGPGNFRQFYVGDQLPQSSEEILDPHQFWLEAWSTGGILNLIVWLAVCGLFLYRMIFQSEKQKPEILSESISKRQAGIAAVCSVIIANLLAPPETARFLEEVFIWSCLAGGAAVLWVVLTSEISLQKTLLMSAAAVLMIHLQAAGGFAMPLIVQLLLLLSVGNLAVQERAVVTHRMTYRIAAAVAFVLLLVTIRGGVQPRLAESAATARLTSSRSLDRSLNLLNEWAEVDSWNAEPWIQMAGLLEREGGGQSSQALLEKAYEFETEAIQRDPYSYRLHSSAARIKRRKAMLSEAAGDLQAAAYHISIAIELAPTAVNLYVVAAQILEQQGNAPEAATAARKGLELEQINRAAGHSDRWLLEADRRILEKLAGNSAELPTESQEIRIEQ